MNSQAKKSTGRKGKTKALVSLVFSLVLVVGLMPSLSFATSEGQQTQGNESNTVTQQQTEVNQTDADQQQSEANQTEVQQQQTDSGETTAQQQQTTSQEEGASLASEEKENTADTGNYLTFTAQADDSSVTFNYASADADSVQYSTDGVTWEPYTKGTKISLTNVGDKVSFKGTNVTTNNSNHFSMTGKIAASGDVTSLTNESGGNATLAEYCYYSMFDGCTALTAAPKLPATTLAESCYCFMFDGCTALTAAPKLPATTLAKYCYWSMFQGCTSLSTAPELPATTLAECCYYSMFQGCTSLTTAPELPVTTLAEGCYLYMFSGCTSLTTAPKLPATTLAENCYYYMFYGCTSLSTAPELSATTLVKGCYYSMFYGCTSLSTAPELPATTLAEYCYYSMFRGCTSLSTAPELSATTLVKGCYCSMFQGCTSLTTSPELPATTLAESCYYLMFSGCTALEAPAIMSHVATLAGSCCKKMYQGCTKLEIYTSSQPGCAKEWKATNATVTEGLENWATDMFTGCGGNASEEGFKIAAGTPYYIKSDLTIGDQTGDLTYGKAGTATYTLTKSARVSLTDYSVLWKNGDEFSATEPEGVTAEFGTDYAILTVFTADTAPAGTYSFKITAKNGDENISSNEATLVVNKVPVSVPTAITGLVYNGSQQTGVASTENALYTLSGNTETNAGNHTAIATLNDKDNYEWNLSTPTSDNQNISWSIAKRPITLTSASDSKVYDGTALTKDEVSLTSGSFANDEGATYDVTGSQTQVGIASNAFNVKEWTGGAKEENYNITRVFGTLEVTPAAGSETEAMVDADSFKAAKESLEKKYSAMPEYLGKAITVDMTVNKAAASSEDVAKIQQKVGSKTLLSFDTTLTVKADGDEIKTAGDDNTNLITVTYAFDFSKKQDIQVMRLHKKYEQKANDAEYTVTESIDELTETANANGEYVTYDKDAGTVSVTACKYSTFSIAYNVVDDSQSSGTTTTKNTTAKTGDNTGIAVGALAVAALCAAGALGLARRRNAKR